MPIQITIRNVPERVRNELASRAALQKKSMQEYLVGELERIASAPPIESWLQTVQENKQVYGVDLTSTAILEARDQDRE